jgi:hypothetical protein
MSTPREGGWPPDPDDLWAEGSLSETHAHVEQPSPMTYEGVIAAYGNIARETKHGTGWRRIVGIGVCIMVLGPIAAGFVVLVLNALFKL